MNLIIIKLRDSYKRLSSVLVMILASVSVFARIQYQEQLQMKQGLLS